MGNSAIAIGDSVPQCFGVCKALPISHTQTDGTFFDGTDNTELLLLSNDELSKPTSWQSFPSKFDSVNLFEYSSVMLSMHALQFASSFLSFSRVDPLGLPGVRVSRSTSKVSVNVEVLDGDP